MEIRIRRNDLFMEGTCVMCGEEFPPDIIIATAYDASGEKSFGDVCPRCIYEGAEAMQAAARTQIENLRARAERLLSVATELEHETQGEIDVPTWQQWRQAHLRTFLAQIGKADDPAIKAFRETVQTWDEATLASYLAEHGDDPPQDDPDQQARYAIAWHERDRRHS